LQLTEQHIDHGTQCTNNTADRRCRPERARDITSIDRRRPGQRQARQENDGGFKFGETLINPIDDEHGLSLRLGGSGATARTFLQGNRT
jgi:hypothetical protein